MNRCDQVRYGLFRQIVGADSFALPHLIRDAQAGQDQAQALWH